ncbi:fucokinase [Thermoflexales bacterium]|nr:fucokinase [Thermoflexales bacterium]
MSELIHVDFLQQAYHDNWQQYLASLKPNAKLGWDVCVLTASDERQANMYRGQLAWRRMTNLLPAQTRFLVIADPDGQRIGSGGATLRVLAQLAREDDTLTTQRILIIHSGGDSRRLPICSATGKLFARVPRVLPDGRASTVFDEFLIGLSGLSSATLPPGVLVASGDVLLVFDHLQISFQRGGVIGVAAAAPVEMGLRHGVYVHGDSAHRVQAYLHKPAAEELTHWKAIHADGTVQIDTGLVWLDAATALKYAALIQSAAVGAICCVPPFELASVAALNFYGDLVLPLAQSTTLEDYLADTSDGPATPEVQKARQVIWQRLRGTSFTSERLHPAMFIHFGTSREYWETVAADTALQRICGWVRSAAAWTADDASALALINAAVENVAGPADPDQPVLIVDSCLSGSLTRHGAAIVASVNTARPIELAQDVVLDQLPLAQGFVTRIFGLHDDPKRAWGVSGSTFMNHPWPAWLAAARLDPELLWPNVPVTERTLWNARLYPVAPTRDESLVCSLPLQDPARATPEWRAKWAAAPRLSLAASFAGADSERILSDLAEIEDLVAARHFYGAIQAQQPAAEARTLMGSVSSNVARRCALIDSWLAQADPILQLRGYKALAAVSEQSAWEDRAFAVLAQLIESSVNEQVMGRTHAVQLEHGHSVQVKAAARVDFGGGWTDTPPYSLEQGGTVLNAAILLRGAHPIVAEATWLDEPRLILESPDIEAKWEPVSAGELLSYANPADLFALQKAALVLKGLVPASLDPNTPVRELCRKLGGGLKLITQTSIPRGSGLGTSSIMAGAVLQCLSQLSGVDTTPAQLCDEVLCLEQMLTTGGGWQDQVGGLWGGIKLISTAPGLPQQIRVETVELSPETQVELSSRLILVYTGRQRLAKNLLRSVMGRWMARDPEMVWIQQEIARLALAMREALLANDVSRFGELLSEHWAINKRMDPGCTNDFIDHLFEVMSPQIDGAKLAGAGGGGFAIVVARSRAAVRELAAELKAHYQGTPVEIWECAIPEAGMLVQTLVPGVVDRV